MITNYDDLAKKINSEIKSPILKKMLFGMDNVEAYAFDDCISVINGLLNFGFLTVFIKWRNDTKKQYSFPQTPNAKRVFDLFNRIYNGESVGLDLVIYAFTDMQLDEYAHEDESYFHGIISGGCSAVQISSLRPLVKMWFQSAKRVESREEILAEKLLGLYNAMPFLKDVEIRFKEEKLCFEKEEEENKKEESVPEVKGKKVGLKKGDLQSENVQIILGSDNELLDSHALLVKNGNKLYYLSHYENIGDKSRLSYYSLNDSMYFCGLLPKNDFFKMAGINGNARHLSPIIAKSIFSLGFKYINNLALALSDSIRPQTKRKLIKHFSERYYDIFELGSKKENELNWDDIMIFLIVEEGPTELLEFILDPDGFYFDLVLKNLEIRYHDELKKRKNNFVETIKGDYEKALASQSELLNKYTCGNIKTDDEDMIARSLMVKGIIDGVADLECCSKNRSESLFVKSFAMYIEDVEKIIISNKPLGGKTVDINGVLERTFRFVIPFYYGIFAYQEEKEKRLRTLYTVDEVDIARIDKEKEVFFACQEKFKEAAKKCIGGIHKLSLGDLVGEYRWLWESISDGQKRKKRTVPEIDSDDNIFERKGYGSWKKEVIKQDWEQNWKLLKSALGRDKISKKTIDAVLKIKKTEKAKEMQIKLPKDIVNYINKEKHFSGHNAKLANKLAFEEFCTSVRALLSFFMFNDGNTRGQQLPFNPIYPYVVRYSAKSESRDGYYDVNSFTVFPFEESLSCDVKILSLRDYVINEKYYCIPNKSMSTGRWWIEPFLISCSEYDRLIHSCYEDAEDHIQEDNEQ